MGAAEQLPASSLDADRFLRLLADDEPVTFQTFDETGENRPGLSRVLHGSLAEHATTLANLNARGACVCWMVNAGDGKARKSRNVTRVRSLFVDLDGAPLEPVRAAPLQAHCIVESSPNRWHAYWCIRDCPLGDFTRLQKILAERFAGDSKVCDLARVMRLPGFEHRKGKPFRTRLAEVCDRPAYTLAEFATAFNVHVSHGIDQAQAVPLPRKRTLAAIIPEGERNSTLLSLAGSLVRKGHDVRAVNDRLQRVNGERCRPPLCVAEVDGIASCAVAYGSTGFTMLPHKVQDSAEWKALQPPVHDIILTAFRRYDGSKIPNIALTWTDFDGLPGFANKGTFYRHRATAVASGFLLQTAKGSYTRDGKNPDLFTIAPQWLHASQVSKLKPCASVKKVHPYINKQSSVILGEYSAQGQKGNAR